MRSKRVYGSNVTYYTIVHRKKHERHCYSFGYRCDNLDLLRELAEREASEGIYSCVKIINSETNEDFQYFTKAHR